MLLISNILFQIMLIMFSLYTKPILC